MKWVGNALSTECGWWWGVG